MRWRPCSSGFRGNLGVRQSYRSEINIENIEGKDGCKACGWSKEEKEGLEVALHRTQEQVWFGLIWFQALHRTQE